MAAPRGNAASNRAMRKNSVVSLEAPFLPAQKAFKLNREHLRGQARWIRDILDPQVAREGPDALQSDDLLTMDELLRELLDADVSRDDILYSRMHLAIRTVAGLATRWPKKLVERCDALQDVWTSRFGELQGTLLYEPGGRLHGICKPEDLDKEKLIIKWLKSPGARISPMVARKAGHLAFEPGDWWISPLYAHRDGIIDSGSSEGGIVSDAEGAYAIVMTGSDEVYAPDSDTIQYRARNKDPGRYRLTAGSMGSRHPIRILRSHTLNSLWKPRAGLRYEGLYKITGWSMKTDSKTSEVVYLVNFRRLPMQTSFDAVLARPWSEELEDYREYKRLRDIEHGRSKAKPRSAGAVPAAVDGSADSRLPVVGREVTALSEEVSSSQHDPGAELTPTPHDPATLTYPADWPRRRRTSSSVQTVPAHRRMASEADVATQMRRAAWDQR